MAATFTASEVAQLAGVSTYTIYSAVKREEPPIGTLAIKIGNRLVWPRRAIERLFQIDAEGDPA
ncbi:MAG: helix-turn-helix domain-containing protein [Acidimicrobiales bacterium]|jgi:predicted DNA-binding transcriptional regulator AlpA